MANGLLVVEVTYAQQALPVIDIEVRVFSTPLGYDQTFITDENGKTPEISLMAPDPALSLDENNTQVPYSVYHVELRKDGVLLNRIRGVQIFACETALQQIELNPITNIDVEGNDIPFPLTHYSLGMVEVVQVMILSTIV